MNIHSLEGDNTFAQNQSALSVQKNFGRSYIRGLFLNRQAFDGTETMGGAHALAAMYATLRFVPSNNPGLKEMRKRQMGTRIERDKP